MTADRGGDDIQDDTQTALAAARGEARGLLIASEMAERAWAALWQELRVQRADRIDLENGLRSLDLSLTDAKAAAADMARLLAGAQASLAAAEAGARDANAALGDAQAALRDTQAELRDTKDRLAATASLLSEARARLSDTLHSHSWRVTAPVRWLSALILRRR